MSELSHHFCVAPMMDWTDRHCRYFLRLISEHALLYTEMVTTGALIHGDRERFLKFNAEEQPLAMQLGGSNPQELAECSKIAEDAGYLEVNLNVGCPSDRVQNNKIGACLMAEPELVADCIDAMKKSVTIPTTVKCRTGIDEMDSYEELENFIRIVAAAGCRCFIIHARIAVLEGLSPKENREIPPLNYERVYKIKKAFPELEIIINGGIKTYEESHQHLLKVDGVMWGREAYQHPYSLARIDSDFYGSTKEVLSRVEIIQKLYPYIENELSQGTALRHITRHILGLFHSQPGGKSFRRYLSENAIKADADLNTLKAAIELVK